MFCLDELLHFPDYLGLFWKHTCPLSNKNKNNICQIIYLFNLVANARWQQPQFNKALYITDFLKISGNSLRNYQISMLSW